jgi:D-tyrosyl-tRNA(Tyr) deacylase
LNHTIQFEINSNIPFFMKAIIQRVSSASVSIDGNTVGAISTGLLILLGIGPDDDNKDGDYLIQKITQMRIFSDSDGKMNRSVLDVEGEILVVSQFTLFAETQKGNRPSFIKSAPPDVAKEKYLQWVALLKTQYPFKIATGEFGADMQVSLVNDGPVTISIDSKNP